VIAAGRVLLIAAALAAVPSLASAQVYIGRDAPHRGSIEVGGDGTFVGGFDMGSATADLTTSSPTQRFDLFTTESRVDGFPGASVRVGYYLTRSISLEGGMRYARPTLSTVLSDDAENAADVTATEQASHYVFGGSLLVHFPQAGFAGSRGIPFISAGAGHLRELHEGNQLVESGLEYHATAGVKFWLGSGDHRFGVRFEAGLSAREDGLDNKDGRRMLPLVSGGLSYLF